MINFCGQDIKPGDYVGLGVRQGNGTEHRVGRVLAISFEKKHEEGSEEWRAMCLWYDNSSHRKADGYVYTSKQKAHGLFKIDGATLGVQERRCLEIGYTRLKGTGRV